MLVLSKITLDDFPHLTLILIHNSKGLIEQKQNRIYSDKSTIHLCSSICYMTKVRDSSIIDVMATFSSHKTLHLTSCILNLLKIQNCCVSEGDFVGCLPYGPQGKSCVCNVGVGLGV